LLLKNHIWTKPTIKKKKKKKKTKDETHPQCKLSSVIADLHWTKPIMKITLGRNPFTSGSKKGRQNPLQKEEAHGKRREKSPFMSKGADKEE
jgi:hypothetical protein